MGIVKEGSPGVILLGADDKSIRTLKPEPDPIPQHLPLAFIMAKRGTGKRVLTGGSKLPLIYGSSTFDPISNYFNHQTRLLMGVAGEGNTCMVQRIIPDDAGVRSNVAIYIDVLETKVPNYVRNSYGMYVIDPETEAYKVDAANPEIDGYKVKIIQDYVSVSATGGTSLEAKEARLVEIAEDKATLDAVNDADAIAALDAEAAIIEADVLALKNDGLLGRLMPKAGTMVDSDGNKSTMIPLFEATAKYHGEYYNNIGFMIQSLFGSDVDDKIVSETLSLPYSLSLVTRTDAKSSPEIFRSLFGEPGVQIGFKDKVINPNTKARFDIEQIFDTMWFNETDPLKVLKYNDYEGLHFYRANFEKVLGNILAKEKAYISDESKTWDDGDYASTLSWFDFTTADQEDIDDEFHLINPFTVKSSKGIPYFTLEISDETPVVSGNQREVNLSVNTPIFLNGGSDGTISNEMYEKMVRRELAKYLDTDSEVMDLAINVESIIYDTGFTLPTKEELVNFIAVRKDTALVLSTHDAELGERDLPLSDARAIAVALRTRLKLAPESEYFGTGVARAVIMAGTGLLRDGSSADRIPLSYELAIKAARMMGAGNGKWKAEQLFDKAPGNILNILIDISPAFIPAGIKPTLWADGIVWAQPYDRSQYHIPALQTVYSNDTSVLNNFFTICALCTLTKVGAETWRNFTGSTALTDGEFKDAVSNYMTERLKDRFANMYVVIPEIVISEADELRGYSWQVITKLYGNNMKTKMVHSSEVYRMSDLA
jgi:hypothetical protein